MRAAGWSASVGEVLLWLGKTKAAETALAARERTRRSGGRAFEARLYFRPLFKPHFKGGRFAHVWAAAGPMAEQQNGQVKHTESKPLLGVSTDSEAEAPAVPISAIVRCGSTRQAAPLTRS